LAFPFSIAFSIFSLGKSKKLDPGRFWRGFLDFSSEKIEKPLPDGKKQ